MTFKDPRKSPGTWTGYEKEKQIYTKWKLNTAMGAFFDLLDKSCEGNTDASRMWKPRKTIIKALFDQGHIKEAWFLLGPKAKKDSTKYLPEGFKDYGTLHQTAEERTVILIKVGDYIIAEGTFMFALRIWRTDNQYAPKFYQDRYNEDQLKDRPDEKVGHSTEQWLNLITPILNRTLNINLKI